MMGEGRSDPSRFGVLLLPARQNDRVVGRLATMSAPIEYNPKRQKLGHAGQYDNSSHASRSTQSEQAYAYNGSSHGAGGPQTSHEAYHAQYYQQAWQSGDARANLVACRSHANS